MTGEQMPVSPSIIKWARERAGFDRDQLGTIASATVIQGWEEGRVAPTYLELECLADLCEVPIAVFFFPSPPKLPLIGRRFKTIGSSAFERFPPRIQFLMQKAHYRQQKLEDLHRYAGRPDRLLVTDLRYTVSNVPENLVSVVREYLRISVAAQLEYSLLYDPFVMWRDALLAVGVGVTVESFRDNEYRGFCLYDEKYPLIYVNASVLWAEGIFSLFHSLTHLLFGSSGLDKRNDDFVEHLPSEGRFIETLCNLLSTDIVVPLEALENEFHRVSSEMELHAGTSQLSLEFGVTETWMNDRLLTQELITESQHHETEHAWSRRPGMGGGGGDWRTLKIKELGESYIRMAFDCYRSGEIEMEQLADFLYLSPRQAEEFLEYFGDSRS